MDDFLQVTPGWSAAHMGATVGILALDGVANPTSHPEINRFASELEADLRSRFAGLDRESLRAIAPLPAYAAYFRRFGQRYHVGLQLESVLFKGKNLPRVAALVEAMFIAELGNLILTAGHDLDAVRAPVRLDVGSGTESYRTPAGGETAVKLGDMYTADTEGVLSAIITGPAARTRITPETTAVLFVCYAPPGVVSAEVETHLDRIVANIRLITPGAAVLQRVVASATD